MRKAIGQLKNYLIPYAANNFRPRFLERRSAIFLLIIFIGAEVLFLSSAFWMPHAAFFADISSLAIFDLVNKSRAERGLNKLSINEKLQRAAEAKAADMVRNSYFNHISPQGIAPWFWMEKSGYDYYYAGENLARGFIDANSVFDAWMRSETHRANILNGNYSDMGIAVVSAEIAGRKTNIIVQMFGSRRKASLKTEQLKTEKASSVQSAKVTKAFVSDISGISRNFFAAGLAVVFLAFFLNLFIHVKVQHRDLILNGLVLIALVLGVIIFNGYLTYAGLDILEAAILLK